MCKINILVSFLLLLGCSRLHRFLMRKPAESPPPPPPPPHYTNIRAKQIIYTSHNQGCHNIIFGDCCYIKVTTLWRKDKIKWFIHPTLGTLFWPCKKDFKKKRQCCNDRLCRWDLPHPPQPPGNFLAQVVSHCQLPALPFSVLQVAGYKMTAHFMTTQTLTQCNSRSTPHT